TRRPDGRGEVISRRPAPCQRSRADRAPGARMQLRGCQERTDCLNGDPPRRRRRGGHQNRRSGERLREGRGMKVRPLHDRVLLKRVEEEQKTKGGIIIPDTAKEKPVEGKVVAVGSGRLGDDGKLTPLEVKVGNRVLFGKYSGTEVKI